MPPEGSAPSWTRVVSRREARLVFWLVVLVARRGDHHAVRRRLRGLRRTGHHPVRGLADVLRPRAAGVVHPAPSAVPRSRHRGRDHLRRHRGRRVRRHRGRASSRSSMRRSPSPTTSPAILTKVGDVLRPVIELLGLHPARRAAASSTSIQRFVAENASADRRRGHGHHPQRHRARLPPSSPR